MASSDYQTAARAFSKLVRLGSSVHEAMRSARRRADPTPFGKIRRGPAGLTPAPAGELPPLTVGAILDLLLAQGRERR